MRRANCKLRGHLCSAPISSAENQALLLTVGPASPGEASMLTKSAFSPQSRVFAVFLLYASIANPDDEAAELYWGIRIREFGLPIRSAANSDSSTFVIPVNSPMGFRTIHRPKAISRELRSRPPRPILQPYSRGEFTRRTAPRTTG